MKYNKINIDWCFIFWINFISQSYGQNTEIIDCSSEELVTSVFNDPIDLTLRGTIKIYENITINEILSTTNNEFEHNYIDARLEKSSNNNETKNLVLFTTEHFENYAKEQMAARISLKISLDCGMGRERVVIFFQPLKEGNFFSPVFTQSNYEIIVPTPIFAGFDLTTFLEIMAKDDDLTHNQIIFTSNDSFEHHISVGTKNVTSTDKKTYFAKLTLQKILLEMPQPIEFEIIATDSGDPPRSSSASVVLRSDPNRILPVKPKFPQALFKGFINFDFIMEPIKIELVNGTYAPEVQFSLNGVSIEGFNLRDNKDGSIDITWNHLNLNIGDIIKRTTWELELKAEHKKLSDIERASLIVELADFKTNFNFISSYYEGNIDELGELHITPVIFNLYTYQPDINFNLQSLNDFFYFSVQNFSIQLQLNSNFTWQGIDDIGYIKLTLEASWENLSAMTHIVIKLPQIKNETPQMLLQFEKPLYVGQLNEKYILELETIIVRTDVNKTQEIQYNLSGNYSDKFYLIKNYNRIEIKTIVDFVPDPGVKWIKSYLLLLQAKYRDFKSFASVMINGPESNNQIKRKVFVASFARGRILIHNDTQKLSMDSIPISQEFMSNFSDLVFHLKGDSSLHFGVNVGLSNHTVDIVLKTPLSSNILNSQHFLNMTLQVTLSGSGDFNDSLLVFVELPMKECPESTTPLLDTPKFSNSNYVFTASTNQTGIVGVVNAFSHADNYTLHYSLDVQDDLLAQRLFISPYEGELTLNGIIKEGNYRFNISAENIETHERAVANAVLKVLTKEECKLYEQVVVEKTLAIRHIDEEKPFYGLFDLKFNENCTFHIVDMWPNDKEYVHVNYIFNMLDTIAVDREDEIFQNMSEPQILVKLNLKCNDEDKLRNLTIDIPNAIEQRASQIQFTEDLLYSPDIMWLYIKIDDINDNAPEFKFNEGPIYLGYPSSNAAFDIYPEYLIKIEAFDKDLDFNAKIKFIMRDNPFFDIEAETGKIYPKGKALEKDDQTELIVLAVDQNGAGLESGTVVIVKALMPDFYSLVTLRDNYTRTKQDMEKILSTDTGYNINVIKMSYVPQAKELRSTDNQSLSCKAWIYAYKGHQLVPYRELQDNILARNPQANIENIESYNEAALHQPSQSRTHLVYLIATIVLSLVSSTSLIFIIWRFCNNPTVNTKYDSTTLALPSACNTGNGQQEICMQCSHGSDNANDYTDCNKSNYNHVKLNDLVESVIVKES